MKKPDNFKWKLFFLTLYGILLLAWMILGLPCVPRVLTGFPCPTCGFTRAWLYALQWDFLSAFRMHPMFWSVPILVLFFLYDGQPFPHSGVNRWCLGMLICGIVLIWIVRLLGLSCGLYPL